MENQRIVLLVEDNPKLNEINCRALETEGYLLLSALTLAEAEAHLQNHEPDVILLDVMMPDGDGMEFCKTIRNSTRAHILFLTARARDEDKLRGLDTGGDDYITKPYKLEELLSRVRAVMRRRGMEEKDRAPSLIQRGSLVLNLHTHQALLKGVDMNLTHKEFGVLRVLAETMGNLFSKEDLYLTVWKRTLQEDDRPVKSVIYRLRKKLEAGEGGLLIATVRGEGYRLDFEKNIKKPL